MKTPTFIAFLIIFVCAVRAADEIAPCAGLKAFRFETVELSKYERRSCDGPSRLASEGIEAVGYYENTVLRYFTASLIGAAGVGEVQMKVGPNGDFLVHYVEREFERQESTSMTPRKVVRFSFLVSSGQVVWCGEERGEEVLAKVLVEEIARLVGILNAQKKATDLH